MPPRSVPLKFVPHGSATNPAYASAASSWACAATASPGCSVPPVTIPGGKPVIAVPGLTPTSPVTSVWPVLVTVDAPSTANVRDEPSAGCARALVATSTRPARTSNGSRRSREALERKLFMRRAYAARSPDRCSIEHRTSAPRTAAQDQRGERERDSAPADNVADAAVDRAVADEADVLGHHRTLEHVRLLQHAAVGIDEAADAGVGGAREVATLFDAAQRRLFPMLVGGGRPAVPRVV